MTFEPTIVWVILSAFLLELAIGYPASLWRVIGHPVSWMGQVITLCDRFLNTGGERPVADLVAGVLSLALLISLVGGMAISLHLLTNSLPFGWVVEVLIAATLLAGRSLYEHVVAVADGLCNGGIAVAREKIAMIVGRDPQGLDEPAISRAAIETLAENTSDGVVAPIFWGLVGGLPGLAIYKAVNTADSMIGHRSERHLWFGKAAARLDDLMNLIPARLTGFLFVATAVAQGNSRTAFASMWRDAPRHFSPNAGWPEAAMAGALDCRLGGPRTYDGGDVTEGAWLGDGPADIGHEDIHRALDHYKIAIGLVATFLFITGLLTGGLMQ